MAEDNIDIDETGRLRARRERMSTAKRRRSPLWTVLFFMVLLALVAVFVVFPDQARRLLGFDTSSSVEIQQASEVDNSGISTQIQRDPEIRVEALRPAPTIEPPGPPAMKTKLNPEVQARLDAFEQALKDIANRPASDGGPSADDIKNLLDRQAAALRREAETSKKLLQAQLEALRAQAKVPTSPTAKELSEQERLRLEAAERAFLEQQRAKREAELLERVTSNGNVYDESEEGKSTSGTKEGDTGVRELSDNEKFLKDAASQGWETAKASPLEDISRTIVQGTLISAVLETAIDTELPGNIRAQVTRPVYSYDGQNILMPAGTRLIGAYNPKISIAQNRVLIAWNRAITPEGKSVKLAATGIDRLGRGGQDGNVDTRFFEKFGSAVLITSIAAIPSFLASDEVSGATTEAATEVAQDASEDLGDSTEDILEEYLSLPPIIRVPQGTLMKVLVNQDLVFS